MTNKITLYDNTSTFEDNKKLLFGTGEDISVYYDGTDFFIVTDNVAASDLVIDCGTSKTIELAETVWDDQQIVLGSTRFAGSSDPTWTLYKGGQVLLFNKVQDNIIYFTAQLSHKYKLGTNLSFHVHMTPVDDVAENQCRWVLTYTWADIGTDFPAETTTATDQTVAANTADSHTYFEVDGAVSSASAEAGVSGVLLCSLMREGTHANDDLDSDVYLTAIDFHYEIDTVGSRQEAVK